MTPFGDRLCKGLTVVAALGIIAFSSYGYEKGAMTMGFITVALCLLPVVVGVKR